ncbi:hypothetical protein [Bosea sp. TAB14]
MSAGLASLAVNLWIRSRVSDTRIAALVGASLALSFVVSALSRQRHA